MRVRAIARWCQLELANDRSNERSKEIAKQPSGQKAATLFERHACARVIQESGQQWPVTKIISAQLDAIEMLGALVSVVRRRNESDRCAMLDR